MASRLKNKDIFIEWSKGFITKAAVIIEPYNAFANSLPFLIRLFRTPHWTGLTPNGPKPRRTFQCKESDWFQSTEGAEPTNFDAFSLKTLYSAKISVLQPL